LLKPGPGIKTPTLETSGVGVLITFWTQKENKRKDDTASLESIHHSTWITDLQNGWSWKGPLEVTWSTRPTQAGPLRARCPGACPSSFWISLTMEKPLPLWTTSQHRLNTLISINFLQNGKWNGFHSI